jgi:hypothetical protein
MAAVVWLNVLVRTVEISEASAPIDFSTAAASAAAWLNTLDRTAPISATV